MTDSDGNAIEVGYEGMLMFKVVSVSTNAGIVWQGGLNNSQMVLTQDGSNAHKGQGNWPAVPA